MAQYDKLRSDALDQIERSGICYTNEAKAMARELKELREKLKDVPDYMIPKGLRPT